LRDSRLEPLDPLQKHLDGLFVRIASARCWPGLLGCAGAWDEQNSHSQ
jgi:hypothetical protein